MRRVRGGTELSSMKGAAEEVIDMAGRPRGEAASALTPWRDAGAASVSRRRGRRSMEPVGALRFAFYGRLSTMEHQDSDSSRAVIIELGARSMRESQRTRHRVIEAMRVQTRDQGRYLGGRPPYGYRLIAGGPHPTPSHARWGRRLRLLDPGPVTAPYVQRICVQTGPWRSPGQSSRSRPARCRWLAGFAPTRCSPRRARAGTWSPPATP
jgi:hypothetical protein